MEFNDESYLQKRETFRSFSVKPEIANCVDTIADDIFAYFKSTNTIPYMQIDWHQMQKYLIDGYLAFELIYDQSQRVIGKKELDAITIIPSIDETGKKMWKQHDKVFSEDQIIFIAYNNASLHTSYVESIMRSYNQLTMIEDAKLVEKLTSSNTLITADVLQYFRDKFTKASRIESSTYPIFTRKHFNNIESALN